MKKKQGAAQETNHPGKPETETPTWIAGPLSIITEKDH